MYFIYVVSDYFYGDNGIISAEEIVEILIERKTWLFSPFTPNLSKIGEEDKVVIYLAGKGRKVFVASFEIDGKVTLNSLHAQNEKERVLFEMFSLSAAIKNAEKWEYHVPIKSLISTLDFITLKSNFGVFLRKSTKVIQKADFERIMSSRLI